MRYSQGTLVATPGKVAIDLRVLGVINMKTWNQSRQGFRKTLGISHRISFRGKLKLNIS